MCVKTRSAQCVNSCEVVMESEVFFICGGRQLTSFCHGENSENIPSELGSWGMSNGRLSDAGIFEANAF
jgi:hypothetical protein